MVYHHFGFIEFKNAFKDENLGRSAASSVQEKKILSEMNNVFLVKLRATSKVVILIWLILNLLWNIYFQDTKNIYFLFDVVYGGDLFSRLKEKRRLE